MNGIIESIRRVKTEVLLQNPAKKTREIFVLINPYFNDSLTIVHIAVRTFWVTVRDNIGGVTARPRINIRQLPSCQRYN